VPGETGLHWEKKTWKEGGLLQEKGGVGKTQDIGKKKAEETPPNPQRRFLQMICYLNNSQGLVSGENIQTEKAASEAPVERKIAPERTSSENNNLLLVKIWGQVLAQEKEKREKSPLPAGIKV